MDSEGHLKRKDTTKGPPLRILSLDGGGVRGYSMFIIIQELMLRTYVETEGRAPRRDQIPKPCDHFDLIVGTGTGGLIALMLGRLRLDLEQCKELYVRMTRMVFESDKTIVGIPYRSTLFKASMLERAIKEAVREHTVSDDEGNDGTTSDVFSPLSAISRSSAATSGFPRRHQSNASTVSFSGRSPAAQTRSVFRGGWGNPDAQLYDTRENRTKTAVTAMYKGTSRGGSAALLRSYDSRKEPAPEYDCKIWEAGRATCAIGLAFKPVKIGQTVFHDDGAGTFNPSPYALDEATVNEWPGRDVGVFISIGTGKRPKGTDQNQHVWYEGFIGEYAEARKKLIQKVEGCEAIHERMKKELLMKRGVNIENYYRFNVEVGVGEFAMNEWDRLGEISTGTKRYLGRDAEQKMVQQSSTKLAKIHRAKQRFERLSNVPDIATYPAMSSMNAPLAVELPGDFPTSFPTRNSPPSRESYESGIDHLSLPGSGGGPASTPSSRGSGEAARPPTSHASPPQTATRPQQKPPASPALSPAARPPPPNDEPDRLIVTAPTPAQYRNAAGSDKIAITGVDEYPRRPQRDPIIQPMIQPYQPHRIEPPPLPPKTPLPEKQLGFGRRPNGTPLPPYPMDEEGPPPIVNMARKPEYRGR
ncbi:FabD/lysophospholipase-like protein [Annulohypoxylon bovei var. microspora]|nr:FabD/lysophospholipase-like protein [Annulohypoxylon bovei var. microspora]